MSSKSASTAAASDSSRSFSEDNSFGNTFFLPTTTPQVFSYKELNETHTAEDVARLERVRKLIFEIKKSPKYVADIMRGFVARNAMSTRT